MAGDLHEPPIGIIPRYLWLEKLEIPGYPSRTEKKNRAVAVQEAISRYNQSSFKALPEWFEELTYK